MEERLEEVQWVWTAGGINDAWSSPLANRSMSGFQFNLSEPVETVLTGSSLFQWLLPVPSCFLLLGHGETSCCRAQGICLCTCPTRWCTALLPHTGVGYSSNSACSPYRVCVCVCGCAAPHAELMHTWWKHGPWCIDWEAEVYGNHHESLAGEIKLKDGRVSQLLDIQDDLSADELVEKIGIGEEVSVDQHFDMHRVWCGKHGWGHVSSICWDCFTGEWRHWRKRGEHLLC